MKKMVIALCMLLVVVSATFAEVDISQVVDLENYCNRLIGVVNDNIDDNKWGDRISTADHETFIDYCAKITAAALFIYAAYDYLIDDGFFSRNELKGAEKSMESWWAKYEYFEDWVKDQKNESLYKRYLAKQGEYSEKLDDGASSL
jgi:hypothetical protein